MSESDGGSNLARRALSACAFVPAIVGLCLAGGWALFGLVVAIVGRGSWELLYLARRAGLRSSPAVAVPLALAFPVWLHLRGLDAQFALLVLGAVLVALMAALRQGVEGFATSAFLSLGAALYVGLLGSAPLLLARHPGSHAPWLVVAVFACLWLTDAAAYAGGRAFGRRRLVPSISPGKTVVGLFCGLAGGLVPVALYRLLPAWTPAELAGLFLLVSASGQVGDIVESALKRDFGTKDAPALIPGHGGVLDRFDSYLFGFPAAYLYTLAVRGT